MSDEDKNETTGKAFPFALASYAPISPVYRDSPVLGSIPFTKGREVCYQRGFPPVSQSRCFFKLCICLGEAASVRIFYQQRDTVLWICDSDRSAFPIQRIRSQPV